MTIYRLTSVNIHPTWIFRLPSVTDDFRAYSLKACGVVRSLKYHGLELCGLRDLGIL